MRLVCPNCEAKYEVPEDAIPETGRDVQCANCGHAWYQMRPRPAGADMAALVAEAVKPPVAAPMVAAPAPEPTAAPEGRAALDPVPETESEPEPELEPTPTPEPAATEASLDGDPSDASADVPDEAPVAPPTEASVEAVAIAPVLAAANAAVETLGTSGETLAAEAKAAMNDLEDSATAASDSAEDADDAGDAPAAVLAGAVPAAYAVDDSVLAILREEAEREASARKADVAKPLEVQSDLGIDAAMPAARKPVEVISTDDPAPAAEDDPDGKLAARRSRLPDVEEIKSTLRPSAEPADDPASEAPPVAAEGRSSFRSGFLLVMTLAILGMALYASADAVANAVPALAGALKAYVGFVDGLRLQLDGLMQSATVAINGSGA